MAFPSFVTGLPSCIRAITAFARRSSRASRRARSFSSRSWSRVGSASSPATSRSHESATRFRASSASPSRRLAYAPMAEASASAAMAAAAILSRASDRRSSTSISPSLCRASAASSRAVCTRSAESAICFTSASAAALRTATAASASSRTTSRSRAPTAAISAASSESATPFAPVTFSHRATAAWSPVRCPIRAAVQTPSTVLRSASHSRCARSSGLSAALPAAPPWMPSTLVTFGGAFFAGPFSPCPAASSAALRFASSVFSAESSTKNPNSESASASRRPVTSPSASPIFHSTNAVAPAIATAFSAPPTSRMPAASVPVSIAAAAVRALIRPTVSAHCASAAVLAAAPTFASAAACALAATAAAVCRTANPSRTILSAASVEIAPLTIRSPAYAVARPTTAALCSTMNSPVLPTTVATAFTAPAASSPHSFSFPLATSSRILPMSPSIVCPSASNAATDTARFSSVSESRNPSACAICASLKNSPCFPIRASSLPSSPPVSRIIGSSAIELRPNRSCASAACAFASCTRPTAAASRTNCSYGVLPCRSASDRPTAARLARARFPSSPAS